MTRILCLAGAVALLAACTDQTLKVCDITQPDCQQEVYYGDLRLRGDGYDPFAGIPPIRTIDTTQFRKELEDQAQAAAAAAQNQAPTPWVDEGLFLLGLVSSTTDTQGDSIDNQVSNTAAYYSPETRDVTVIAHPELNVDARSNMQTLAHELVHAMQDREIDLDLNPQTTDEYFANKALIEGDATFYGLLFEYNIPLPAGGRFNYPNPQAYLLAMRDGMMSDQGDPTSNFASLGPPYYAVPWLVYPLGGLWIADHWTKGGNAAVRHSYGSAPKRSLDYVLGPGVASPAGTDICAPAAPTGFSAKIADSFGAAFFFGYLMAWKVPSADSLSTAQLWRNDAILIYYNQATQKTAVAWRIELGSPLSDSLLATLNTAAGPRVVQTGATLMITASDDSALLATWNPGVTCR